MTRCAFICAAMICASVLFPTRIGPSTAMYRGSSNRFAMDDGRLQRYRARGNEWISTITVLLLLKLRKLLFQLPLMRRFLARLQKFLAFRSRLNKRTAGARSIHLERRCICPEARAGQKAIFGAVAR